MPKMIRRALISVFDKTGLTELGRGLSDREIEIVSTGGSARALSDAGVPVVEVSDYTGFPEILDGRVKTLHPRIHAGLLSLRSNPEHEAAMAAYDLQPIDLLVVNLYPFAETLAAGADEEACIETIDVGGPAMIRAAAKNHAFVTVVVDRSDYGALIEEIAANNGATTLAFRTRMAAAAFARCAAYDSTIATWLARASETPFARTMTLAGEIRLRLRYGENPHQEAALYVGAIGDDPGIANARQLQGKELSFNNLGDADAAFELASEFDAPAAVIAKHANPCGVAVAATLEAAFARALACDPMSAFGGIIALNRTLDAATAERICAQFVEVVVAPDAEEDARAVLAKKKNLRVLITGGMADPAAGSTAVRGLSGGFLVQRRDNAVLADRLEVVTKRQPTEAEITDLRFAFTVCKHVKSNAIVLAKGGATVGIGAGQMSRVDSARIAAWKAAEAGRDAGEKTSRAKGSVVASDAFFPFPDGLLEAAGAGATAAIQPGGSVRDDEVIAAANEKGLAMVFTGVRHFRH
jgi:phosphoribosylaminoimidazolecarboxamide formyltransferase/IMP cyclohydrolase